MCVYVCMYVCVIIESIGICRLPTCMCVYVCMCMYVCMCVCVIRTPITARALLLLHNMSAIESEMRYRQTHH